MADWDTWKVIDAKFRDPDNLIIHQLGSFNDLIDRTILQLIETHMPIKVKEGTTDNSYEFNIIKVTISKPVQQDQVYKPLYPHEARVRGMSYSGTIYIDYEEIRTYDKTSERENKKEVTIERKVPIGNIPIMLGSKYCHLYGLTPMQREALGECREDRGGYFIVNGNEKVIISQERPAENTVWVFPETDANKPYIARAEVKSTIDQRFFPIKISTVKLTKKTDPKKGDSGQKIRVSLPYIKKEIPLFIVFRALGVTKDKQILEYLLGDLAEEIPNDMINLIIPSANEAANVTNELEAIQYIAGFVNNPIVKPTEEVTDECKEKELQIRLRYAKDIINREFIAHVGQNNTKKARFLAYMTQELLYGVIHQKFADRDDYGNKRKDLAGSLMMQIIRAHLPKLFRDIKANYIAMLKNDASQQDSVRKKIQKCTMETKLKNAMATGNWHTNKQQANMSSKKGISQVLQRLSYNGTLSHLRRIQSPLKRAGSKHEPPRRFHMSQIAKSDPNETPEGGQVGVVKNFAMMAHVTLESNSYPVRNILFKLGVIDICVASSADISRATRVLVNGDLIGIVPPGARNTERIFRYLKMFKLSGKISRFISIAWLPDYRKLLIQTDGGRDCQPVYVVDQNNHMKIEHLLRKQEDPKYLDTVTWSALTEGVEHPTDNEDKDREDIWYPNGYKTVNYMVTDPGDPRLTSSKPDEGDGLPYQYYTKGAVIEYVDTNEEQCANIAIFSEQLEAGQTLLWNMTQDKPIAYGRLSRQRNADTAIPVDTSYQNIRTMLIDLLPEKAKSLFDDVSVQSYDWETYEIRLQYNGTDLPDSVKLVMTNLNRFINPNYIQYTHCCTHPAMWFSVVSQMIPHPDHNQAPRNCYQSAMGKQALGIYATNFNIRFDTMANILTYPQHPIVQTRTMKYTGLSRLPHGYQAIVAIACYGGYNQEDSILLNKAALERGMYQSLFSRTYVKTMQELPFNNEYIKIPPDNKSTLARKAGSGIRDRYHAIEKGEDIDLPKVGTFVYGNDILIPGYKPMSKKKGDTERLLNIDTSVTVRTNEKGMVDAVIPNPDFTNNKNEEGHRFVKVRVAELRTPIVGDKFASRAAQKGTCGMAYEESELLFTECGLVPDIVMNPHAIPSRMTIGHVIEAELGKIGAISGHTKDCTPFTEFSIDAAKNELQHYGFQYEGNEIMYNGKGEPFECAIFCNPTYYQRLKHMVDDKMHARNRGPIQVLTKQPVEGRSRDGGLRFGEMERDCMIGHGAAQFTQEKMMACSDAFPCYHSKEKETFVSVNKDQGIYKYGNQDIHETDTIQKVNVPYALTLLQNELKTVLVDIKLVTD